MTTHMDATDHAAGSEALDAVRARLAARLLDAGVTLPPDELDALAEALLADALRLALDWLESA